MSDIDVLLRKATSQLGIGDLAPLTRGGQKFVYRCRLGTRPAILKLIVLQPPFHENMLERARREVKLLASIDNDHIVKALTELHVLGDLPAAPEGACWLEEELDGTDLSQLLGGPWSWDEVHRMLVDLALGLECLHEKEVVHRDLSPGNVRQTADGHWVVMDPGLARHLAKTSITGMYQPGTPGYRTPEHVPDGEPTPASDVFGLGILAYQALTATLPVLPGGDESEYHRRLREEQAPSAALARPDLSAEQAALVDRMLQRQPARRYLDATELLQALAELQ